MSSQVIHHLPFQGAASHRQSRKPSKAPLVIADILYDFAVCHPTEGVRILNPNDGTVIPFTGAPRLEMEYPLLGVFGGGGTCGKYFRAVVVYTNANRDFDIYTRAPEVLVFPR